MTEKSVCIRINEEDWESFKEIAERIGFSRNALIRIFIRSVITGKTQIEQKTNILNVNINIVPINNSNTAFLINQTKALKNKLVLEEMEKSIKQAKEIADSGRAIPYGLKDYIRKLLDKASFIPPELFDEARKIILT